MAFISSMSPPPVLRLLSTLGAKGPPEASSCWRNYKEVGALWAGLLAFQPSCEAPGQLWPHPIIISGPVTPHPPCLAPHLADFPEFGSGNGCGQAGGPGPSTTGALCCGERGRRGWASPCSMPCSRDPRGGETRGWGGTRRRGRSWRRGWSPSWGSRWASCKKHEKGGVLREKPYSLLSGWPTPSSGVVTRPPRPFEQSPALETLRSRSMSSDCCCLGREGELPSLRAPGWPATSRIAPQRSPARLAPKPHSCPPFPRGQERVAGGGQGQIESKRRVI